MNEKLLGAWIVHHTNKINLVTKAHNDFPNIFFAGKCAILLSTLVSDNQYSLTNAELAAYAKANEINVKLELPQILNELAEKSLISRGKAGVELLGMTPSSVLSHTSKLYAESNPSREENAVIEISDFLSDLPDTAKNIGKQLTDRFSLTKSEAEDLLAVSKDIGFFDFEAIQKDDELLFNGNLFRKSDARKMAGILESFSESERSTFLQINALLDKHGILPSAVAARMLGSDVLKKVVAIGLLDISTVANEHGKHDYITKPSSFSKFTDTFADDAFDLAKVLVTSLRYGMTERSASRGRIVNITRLLDRLISGHEVGPATAIGQDYRTLEYKGVIKLRHDTGSKFYMRLLKKEIGRLAQNVIVDQASTAYETPSLFPAQITGFTTPEQNRVFVRRNQTAPLKKGVMNIMNSIRRGNI